MYLKKAIATNTAKTILLIKLTEIFHQNIRHRKNPITFRDEKKSKKITTK